MIEFVGYLDVPLPSGVVFDRLADMSELHRWNPNVTNSRRISGERLSVGSTYLSTIRRGPFRMTAHSTLTHVDPGRSVTYEGSISGFWSADSLRFDDHDGGTGITFQNNTRPPPWLRWIEPVMNAAFQPQARGAVRGAHHYLNESP